MVGVVVVWFFNKIGEELEVGIRVGLKFKFLLRLVRDILCKGVCFCDELEFCWFVILKMDMLE